MAQSAPVTPVPPPSYRQFLDVRTWDRTPDEMLVDKYRRQSRPEFTRGRGTVVAMPFCERDYAAFLALLEWIAALGLVPTHAILCAPHGMPAFLMNKALEYARQAFQTAELISTPFDLPREGWPTGTCWSFLAIANHCRNNRFDFWLNEPDCIPLKSGWFEALEAEYEICGMPYMGFIEPGTDHYPRHMTGNGFYNWQVFHHVRADKLGVAWDIAMADVLTPQCHHTQLFHQKFGPLDHPPTFAGVDSLNQIPRDAVIFHRSKDGTLIRALRERMSLGHGA